MNFRFRNRSEAGMFLAKKLRHYRGRNDVVVLALPRGGVPVGAEVAESLKAPLDVFPVRKIGMPGHEEFALGALANGDVVYLDEPTINSLQVSRQAVNRIIAREREKLALQNKIYNSSGQQLDLAGHIVILVDDGLATGASMRAALVAVRRQNPARVVVAVPVAAASTCEEFGAEADEVVCGQTPEPFFAVGEWYEDFSQVRDEEVLGLLSRATRFQPFIPAQG